MKVVLDLNCSVCGFDQFYMPERPEQGQDVSCARCGTFRCHAEVLAKALQALKPAASQSVSSDRLSAAAP